MTDKPIVKGLWNDELKDTYGENYQDHVLEQYKLYVQMADKVSERRNLANTFFLTLHTLLLSFFGFSLEQGPEIVDKWIIFFPLAAILTLCYAWWRIVKSYRQLNTGKYQVIGEFERRLPTSPYWAAEWITLDEGKNPRKYLPLTHIENWIPIIFGILYIILAVILFSSPLP